jgi:hypothetical protein
MKVKWLLVSVLAGLIGARNWAETKPVETRNAALRYWMAFAEMQDPPAEKETQLLLENTAAGKAAWDEAKLGPILDSNLEALQTMLRATKLPDCDWGLEYGRGPRAPIAYLAKARVMARLNILQVMREMTAADARTAVERLMAGVRFSEHLANGGTLVALLTAKSALLPHFRTLAQEAKKGGLSDAQIKQVSLSVKMLPEDGFDWAKAWELEALSIEAFFDELKHSKVPKAFYEASMGEPMPEGVVVPSPREVAAFRQYMAAVKATLKLSPDLAKAQLEMLGAQKRTLNELAQRLTPAPGRVNDSRAELVAARKALLEVLGVTKR